MDQTECTIDLSGGETKTLKVPAGWEDRSTPCPHSGEKEFTVKYVVNEQVVLSREPKGPLAAHIGAFAESRRTLGIAKPRGPVEGVDCEPLGQLGLDHV